MSLSSRNPIESRYPTGRLPCLDMISSTSQRVSERCMCSLTSSRSASFFDRLNVSGPHVCAPCGARHGKIMSSPFQLPMNLSALARYSSRVEAATVGKSIIPAPRQALMPRNLVALAELSPKKYISLYVVIPAFNISRHASSVASLTNSEESHLDSAGQI